jgi:hypothetical protein
MWVDAMKVIAARSKSVAELTAAGLSGQQQRTVSQLERDGVCVADVVELLGGCGWIRISDAGHQLQVTVDRGGSVLALEGPGRRAVRLRMQ